MTEPLVLAQHVERIFDLGSEHIRAVHDVDLEVNSGQLMMITGRSGSGKTTLLNLLGGLDAPTSGVIFFQGQELKKLSERELTRLRRHSIGFVFQSFGLLPLLSAFENVELALRIGEWNRVERQRRAEDCLAMVGLAARSRHRPYELSGGEMQRVAIARAVAPRPSLILADEPTGELDLTTGTEIFNLLKQITRAENIGIVVATHDVAMTRIADETRQLSDGTFVS
ncbi:MAG: macrolide ABC transporter ATP-binding protein [Chloroflexi bacterium RBG_16_51_9]|nr:MAG: macrolide ABC transporter ATP-binding protein [Chloroflexi bacterium RBG_16_51_9]